MKTVIDGELYDSVAGVRISPIVSPMDIPLDEPLDHPNVGGESSFAGDGGGRECHNRLRTSE